jgi:hypothetical protein
VGKDFGSKTPGKPVVNIKDGGQFRSCDIGQGDSGSPTIAGNRALGIFSSFNGCSGYFTGARTAQSALGVTTGF